MDNIGALLSREQIRYQQLEYSSGALHWCAPMEAGQMSVLICSSDAAATFDGTDIATVVRACRHRVLDVIKISAAHARIENLIDLDAVVVRCSGGEDGLADLLVQLDSLAEADCFALIVIVDLAGLDRIDGLIRSRRTVTLCEPSAEDLIVSIAALSEQNRIRHHLHDIGSEAEADGFDRLNDQLLRLNRMIATLVQDRVPDDGELRAWDDEKALLRSPGRNYAAMVSEHVARPHSAITASQVRALLRVRRLRDHLVAPDLFADPAWDIMLDLLAARLENSQVSVSSLCIAAAVPPTTALRWIRHLTDRGLLDRHADPKDGRRIFIALSDIGMDAVLRWFQESRVHLQSAIMGAA